MEVDENEIDDGYDNGDMEYELARDDAYGDLESDVDKLVKLVVSSMRVGLLGIVKSNKDNIFWRNRQEKLVSEVMSLFSKGLNNGLNNSEFE